MNAVACHVGVPMVLEELKHRPGRRLTLRARGPRGSAIVQLYRADRVGSVAARMRALGNGPREPVIPNVLEVDQEAGLLLISDVAGAPLRNAVLASDADACERAGHALGAWHMAWMDEVPAELPVHTVADELAEIVDRARLAPAAIRMQVRRALPELDEEWATATAVHRSLTEEKILIGELVGLIGLDRASAGPPELDVGTLLAQLDLFALRTRRDVADASHALLAGYRAHVELDPLLVDHCRRLGRLRLACVHEDQRLLEPVRVLTTLAGASSA